LYREVEIDVHPFIIPGFADRLMVS
jgi:hypothetical protein